MTSIRILHASDLHIAVGDQRRSYVDAISDAVSTLPNLDPKLTWIALRKLALASSYEPQVLEDLAEFIVNNVRGVKPDVAQLIESVAKQHDIVILNEKLDAIVLTGDLATTGLEHDLRRVHSFLNADYEPDTPHKPKDAGSIIAAISAVNTDITPIACLPGNHDRYSFPVGLPTYMPGCRSFDTLLLDYQHQPVRKIVVPSNSDLKVVIFAADFTLRRLRDSKGPLGW